MVYRPARMGTRAMGSKKSKKQTDDAGEMLVCKNPKGRHDYEIIDTLECGMVLAGSEVKSLRARHASIEGGHAAIEGMEMWLYGMHIGPYEQAGRFGHEARRRRKLLAHRHEIERWLGKVAQKGFTLVPLRVYFSKGRAKVEIALARGRKVGDQRESLKRKVDLREARDAMAKGRR